MTRAEGVLPIHSPKDSGEFAFGEVCKEALTDRKSRHLRPKCDERDNNMMEEKT